MSIFVPGIGYVATQGAAQVALANRNYSPQQLQIAQSIAASQVPSAFPAGGSSRIGSWVAEQTAKIANELFKQPEPAPAPSGGGGGGGGGGASPQQQQLVELSAASEKYRQESEAALKAAQAQIEQMKIQQQAPLIEAANMARGKQTASLQIQPSSTTPQTAGTQAFKRRRQPTEMPSIQSLGTLNVPTSSVLNV